MPALWPKVNVPVFANATAFVIVLPLAVRDTLFTVLPAVKLVAVTTPVKLAVPPIFSNVKALMLARLVPVTFAFEILTPVSTVKLLEAPVTAPKVILPADVVACVFKVTALPKVTAPNVIAVLDESNVPFNVTTPPTLVVVNPPV